jgi:hypothetical protein
MNTRLPGGRRASHSALAQGEVTNAHDAIMNATVHAQMSKDVHASLSAAVTSARILAVKDEPKNAKEELVRMLIEANRFGFIDLRLDATFGPSDGPTAITGARGGPNPAQKTRSRCNNPRIPSYCRRPMPVDRWALPSPLGGSPKPE